MANGIAVSSDVVAQPAPTVAEIQNQINTYFTTVAEPQITNQINTVQSNLSGSISNLQDQVNGFAPSGANAQAITVGGTPFTFTNPSSTRGCLVIVSGGTVTTITLIRNGTPFLVGLLAGAFQLSPGDSLRVAYVLAPTMTLIPF